MFCSIVLLYVRHQQRTILMFMDGIKASFNLCREIVGQKAFFQYLHFSDGCVVGINCFRKGFITVSEIRCMSFLPCFYDLFNALTLQLVLCVRDLCCVRRKQPCIASAVSTSWACLCYRCVTSIAQTLMVVAAASAKQFSRRQSLLSSAKPIQHTLVSSYPASVSTDVR